MELTKIYVHGSHCETIYTAGSNTLNKRIIYSVYIVNVYLPVSLHV